jgi:hypothetical protein
MSAATEPVKSVFAFSETLKTQPTFQHLKENHLLVYFKLYVGLYVRLIDITRILIVNKKRSIRYSFYFLIKHVYSFFII